MNEKTRQSSLTEQNILNISEYFNIIKILGIKEERKNLSRPQAYQEGNLKKNRGSEDQLPSTSVLKWTPIMSHIFT